MKFIKSKIRGVFLIKRNKFSDARGIFYRLFCKKIFKRLSKKNLSVQTNICINKKKLTFRGFHYQKGAYGEDKIISCVRGEVLDYIIDLRKSSKTYLMYERFKLNEKNIDAVFVPRGCAHGYLTTMKDTIVVYNVSNYYNSKQSTGIRYNDPKINIKWTIKPKIISVQDKKWKNL